MFIWIVASERSRMEAIAHACANDRVLVYSDADRQAVQEGIGARNQTDTVHGWPVIEQRAPVAMEAPHV